MMVKEKLRAMDRISLNIQDLQGPMILIASNKELTELEADYATRAITHCSYQ